LNLSPSDLAQKYLVDDLPGATTPGARLHGILKTIEAGRVPTAHVLAFLAERGLLCLHDLAAGNLTLESFRAQSSIERDSRIAKARQQAAAKAAALENQAALRDAKIETHFEAMENDPVLKRRR